MYEGLIVKSFTKQNITDDVVNSVLSIQKSNSFHLLKDHSFGFLFTLWDKAELQKLVFDGGKLYVLYDRESGALGYALLCDMNQLLLSYQASQEYLSNPVVLPTVNSKYLYQISMSPNHRAKGLGKFLLCKIEDDFRGSTLFLDYMEEPHCNKASHDFFTHLGYSKFTTMQHLNYRDIGCCKWTILRKYL